MPLPDVSRFVNATDNRSWWLADGQKLADEFPYTFHKPSAEAVSLLSVGDAAKLIFRFDGADPDAPNAERMWVEIRAVGDDGFHGVLDNDPSYIRDLDCGDPVHFEERHIIQVSIDDPVPSSIDKFLPRCIVSNQILLDGQPVDYMYREASNRENDSGWRFLAGDESTDYLDDAENVRVVSLGALLREDDSVLDLLDAPVGSAFERRERSGRFVAVIADLED